MAFGINTAAKTVNIATTLRLEGASSRAALAIAAQTMAVRGLSVAYGALGGPLGLLLLTAGSFAFLKKKQLEAKKSTDDLAESIGDLTIGIEKLSIEEARYKRDNLETRIQEAKEREASIRQELKEIESQREFIEKRGYKKLSMWGKETLDIEKNAEESEKLRKKKNELEFEQKKLTESIRSGEEAFKSYDDVINRVANNMDNLTESSDAVRKKLDEVVSKIKDDTARLSLKTEVEVFRHEWNNTTKWDEYKTGSEKEQEEVRAQIEAAYAEFDNKKKIVNQTSKRGVDIAKEYQRVMESTLSDEDRRGLELQKNLDILRQYGASEADILAVRRAAYESMSVDLPGMGEGGDTLTAQLARIGENMAQLDAWREEQLQKLELAYGNEESALAESLERREELEKQYRERRSQFEGEMNQELMNLTHNMTSDSLSALREAGLESTAIGKATFFMNRGISASNTVISALAAGTKAMELLPGMPGVALGKSITARGMINAGLILGTGLKGMAHSGIDKVPETGTWLLEKGERVVTANTSAKLDATLENLRKNSVVNNNTGGDNYTTVNVTVNSSGDVESESEAGGKALAHLIKEKVVDVISEQFKTGGIFAKG